MSCKKRWEQYAFLFATEIENGYHVQLARGPIGEPAEVYPLTELGSEVLYYINGWVVRNLSTKHPDPMIKSIMEKEQVNLGKAMKDTLPVGCIRRRRPHGGGTYVSNDMFLLFLELERICRGFAVPSVLRRLRSNYGPAVIKYTKTNVELHKLAEVLVKKYAFPLTRPRLNNELVQERLSNKSKLLVNVLVERYMPVRTEDALRWLMDDIGLRKSDAGAIRAQLKQEVTQIVVKKSER